MPDDRIKKLMSYLNSQVEEKKEEKEQAKADAPVKATEKAKLPKIPLTENVKNSIFAPATTPAPFPNATPEATKMYTLQQDKEKEVRNELRGESIDPLQVKDNVKLLEQREGRINQNAEGTAIINTPHYKENYQKRYDALNEEFKNIYEQSTELKKQLEIKETPELINEYNELIERNNYLQREWKGLEQENQAFIKAADKLLINNYSKYVNDKVADIQKTQKELGYNYWKELGKSVLMNSTLPMTGNSKDYKASNVEIAAKKLELAKEIYQDGQKLINAPSKTQGTGLFNFTEEVGGALISERFWKNITALGLKSVVDYPYIMSAIEAGAKGQKLTKEDEMIMDALLSKTIIAAQREGNLSIGYKGAEMFVESIPFILSFLATSGGSSGVVKGAESLTQKAIYNYAKKKAYSKLGKEATDAAIKKAETELMYKMSTSKLAKYVPKIAGVATDMTAGAAMRTPLMPTSYSQFAQDITPTVVAKQNGVYKTEAGMTPLQALGDVYIEVLSESSGSMFTGAAGILGKILNKTPLKNFINSAVGSRLGTVLFNREGIINRAGFNGLISESLEEYFGNAARYVTGVIDKKEYRDFYKWDNQASMIVSFAAMSGIGLIPNEVRRARAYLDYKNNINNIKDLGFDDTGIAEINDLINKTSPKDIPIALANFAIDKQIIQGGEELTTEDQKSLNNLLTYSLAYIQKKGLNNSIQAQNPDIPFGAEVKGTTVSVVNGMGEVLHQNTYKSEAEAKAIAEELNTKIQNIHEEQEAKQDIVDATIEANNPTRSDDGNLYEFTVTEDKPLPTNNYKPKLPNGKLVSVHLISSPEDINAGKVVVVREKYITTNKEGETEIQVADNTVSAEVAKEIFNNSEVFTPDKEREIAGEVAGTAISKAKIQEIEQTNQGFFIRSPKGDMILLPVGEYRILQANEQIVLELEDGSTITTSLEEQEQVQEVPNLESDNNIDVSTKAKKADIERRRQEDLETTKNIGEDKLKEGRENTKKIVESLKQRYPTTSVRGIIIRILEKLIDFNKYSTIIDSDYLIGRNASGQATWFGMIISQETLDGILEGKEFEVQTFIHEFIHGFTTSKISDYNIEKRGLIPGFKSNLTAKEKNAIEQLQRIFEKVKRDNPKSKEYGFTNLDEFIAEAFSNSSFQYTLKNTKAEGKKSNLFSEFINAIGDLLFEQLERWAKRFNKEIPQRETITGILEDVLAWTEDLIDQNNKLAYIATNEEINAKYDAELKALESPITPQPKQQPATEEKQATAEELDPNNPEHELLLAEQELGVEQTIKEATSSIKAIEKQIEAAEKKKEKKTTIKERVVVQKEINELKERNKIYYSYISKNTKATEFKRKEVKKEAPKINILERWNKAKKIAGNKAAITLTNGQKIKGNYYLVEAEAPTASHNPNKNFQKSEGFPVDENGKTINDRDYENDKAAKDQVIDKSGRYDSRAIENPVIVSPEGIVLSGNDRTMSGQLAALQGTDNAYIDYLNEYSENYGFNQEQISEYKHPRIVFVASESIPLTTETFSMFNQDDKKSQNKTEKAVKVGKTISENTVIRIADIFNKHEKLSELYNNSTSTNDIIKILLDEKIIQPNEVSALLNPDETLFSGTGRDFVESLVVGSVLTEDAVRIANNKASIRQAILTSIVELLQNKKMGEAYSLTSEIDLACKLTYEASKIGMSIKQYLSQQVIPEFIEDPNSVYQSTVITIAEELNSDKYADFRKFITEYNNIAYPYSQGQVDLFKNKILTKNEIISHILNLNIDGQEFSSTEQVRTDDSGKGKRKNQRGQNQETSVDGSTEKRGTDGGTDTGSSQESSLTSEAQQVVEGLKLAQTELLNSKQVQNPSQANIDTQIEAQNINTEPTEAQKKVGNYKKGHVTVQGMDISVENPKGSVRSGKDEDGKAWEHEMQSHYGYFLKTEGKDGDHIDVFIGENTESDKIFVVDQINPKTKAFDESKVMLGYNTPEEAKAAYMENYDKDWQGFSAITEVPIEDFKKWAYDGKRQRKPFNEYKETPQSKSGSSEKPNNQSEPINIDLAKEAAEKYGWNAVQSANEIKLFNRNNKNAANITFHKRGYAIYDAAGKQLLSGNNSVDNGIDKVISQYFFGKKVEQSEAKPSAIKSIASEIKNETDFDRLEREYKKAEAHYRVLQNRYDKLRDEANGKQQTLFDEGTQESLFGGEEFKKESQEILSKAKHDVDVAEQEYSKLKTAYEQEVSNQRIGQQGIDFEATTEVEKEEKLEKFYEETQQNENNNVNIKNEEHGNENTTNVSGVLHADNKDVSKGERAESVPSVHKRRTKQISKETSGTLFKSDGEQQPSDVGEGSLLQGNADVLEEQNEKVKQEPVFVPFNPQENDTETFNSLVKYQDNIAALETLNTLLRENRKATAQEKEILSKYVGFGGLKDILYNPELPEVFKESNYKYIPYIKRIIELSKEFDTLAGVKNSISNIKASTANAHFTGSTVINAIYKGISKIGFKGGRILEPSAGTGNFITYMPAKIKGKSHINAVELDDITGNILKYLHDDIKVHVMGIQDAKIPNNSQDLIISNVPFGNYKIYDKNLSKEAYPFQNRIHNYFFAKAIDKAREGGIIAFITSKGVLDSKSNEDLREYLNNKADFLGAVRLPNTTFKNNANTEVVTDIIFLKKNSGIKNNADFVGVSEVKATHKDGEEQNVSVNNYFISHPENMLGDIVAGGLYSRADYTLIDNNSASQLGKVIEDMLPGGVYQEVSSNLGLQANDVTEQIEKIKEGNIAFIDDKLIKKLGSEIIPIEINEPKEKIKLYIDIRNSLMDLIYSEYIGKDDKVLSEKRATLNNLYDNYVSKYGTLNSSLKRIAKQDGDIYNALALEFKENNRYVKADIFKKRTINPIKEKNHAENIEEAIIISLSERASIDIERIAELLQMSIPEVLELSRGKLYEEPRGGYVTAEEYLSGNVKEKLRQAQAAVDAGYIDFQYNVDNLTHVIPKDIPTLQIEARMGSRWIPQEVYSAYARHLFKDESINITYIHSTDDYSHSGRVNTVEATNRYGTSRMNGLDIFVKALVINPPVIKDKEGAVDKAATELAKEKYDEIRESFVDWVYKTEERRELLGRVYNEKFNNTVKRTYNGDHLEIPGIKGVNLYQHQKDTVWRLLQNNGGIVDHIVGSGKTFIMIATTMEMRRTGVAKKPMIMALKSTIPQIVETYRDAYPMAKILAPMEKDFEKKNRMRLFSQIANNEWDCIIMSHENYGKIPHETDIEKNFINEEILEIEAERTQLEADGNKAALKGLETRLKNLRAKLDALSNIKKDNLITFEQMGIDHLMVDESQQFKNLAYVTKQRGIAGLGSNVGSKRAFNLYIGCRYLQGKYEADKGITFLSGTPISNSMAEMYLLLKYFRPNKLNELGFNTFDTWASTFANPTTDVEFTVTGEFKPKTRFREFINVPELSTLYTEIADIRTDDNLKLDKPKMKDNGYTIVNMPMNEEQEEFSKQLIEFAKTKDGHKIGLGNLSEKKKKAYMLIVTNLSSKMAIDMRLIDKNKYNYDPNGKIGRLVDNIVANYRNSESFKGTQLVFSDIGTPKGKGGMAAKLRDYLEDEQGADIDTTNEIFGDKSQDSYKIAPMYTVRSKMEEVMGLSREEIDELIEDAEKAEAGFNLYDEVKLRLIEKGIPEEQIVFIHSYNTNRQKEALFDKVNAGEIRIILGSTQKLGTGVNAQKKLIAIHHLDVPWKPSDMEQRNGRGLRQGNKAAKEYLNNELPVYAYATERTLDGYKYQLLQIKQRFLTQVKTGDIEDRVLKEGDEGDSGVGFAEFVAIMTGNEDILIKGKLEELITKLKRQKRNFFAEIYEAEEQVKKLNITIPIIEQNILKSKENIISVTNTIGKDKEGKFIVKTINGKELKGEEGKEPVRSDYAKEVLKIIKDKLNKASLLEVIPLVTINNHQLIGHKTQEITKEGALRMTIERSNISLLAPNGQSYNVRYSDIPGVFLNNIQNAIENIPNILAMQEKALEKSKKDLIAYNEILNKGTEWEKEGDLLKAQENLKAVTERLNPPKEETKEPEKADDNKIRIGDIDFTLDNEGFISLAQAKNRDGSDIAVVRINEQLKNEDYAKKVKPLIDKHNGEWNKSNKVIIFNSIDDATNFRNAVFDSFYDKEEPTTAIEEISDMFKNGIPAKSPLVTGGRGAMLPKKSDKLLPVEEFVHTHTRQTLYNVKINGRTDEYEQIAAMAKTNNPYNKRHPYSNFSKGFLFEKKEDADKFRNSVNGEVRFNLSKEDEIEKAIQERNDGRDVNVTSNIYETLREIYKGVQAIADEIERIKKAGLKIRGLLAKGKIVISSNQSVEQAVSSFEHERQHIENKTDKEFISIQQNIIDNVDYNELEREVELLSNNDGYRRKPKHVLADEYVSFIVQHFHDKTGFKSSLEYQKIIEDEYTRKNKERLRNVNGNTNADRNAGITNERGNENSRREEDNIRRSPSDTFRQNKNINFLIEDEYKRKNEDRLYGNRGNLYGNRNAGESHAENNRESKDRRNLLSGSVQQAIRGEHTGEEGQRGGIDFLIAGEVESRNAERRAFMDDVEKLNTLLSETEDISREDQIFLEDAVSDLMFNLAPTSDIGFYSTVEKALSNIKQDKGTREQFKAMLLKNGAKQAELDWMGWDEFVGDKNVMTKADIQEWIDGNKVEVEEVTKGDLYGGKYNISANDIDNINNGTVDARDYFNGETPTDEELVNIKNTRNKLSNIKGDFIDWFNEKEETEEEKELQSEIDNFNLKYNDYILFIDRIRHKSFEQLNDTKYSQYQLPGGENYKELLLTMPSREQSWKNIDDFKQSMRDKYGDGWKSKMSNYENDSFESMVNGESKRPAETFRSSHYDEPNILAHVRFNERTVNGERVLFIEEIQSDWAQKGKKEGYGTPKYTIKDVTIAENGLSKVGNDNNSQNYFIRQRRNDFVVESTSGINVAEFDNIEKAKIFVVEKENQRQEQLKHGIPDMPFKKTDQWLNLAARRMMRYAAQNGFDRIAWTNGEQQADRYDLSKQVDSVESYKNSDGTYHISIIKDKSVIDEKNLNEYELEGYLGKNLSEKIINETPEKYPNSKIFKGLDLKVGGEGMVIFYDSIVPSAMSKLGKPFGAKVEEISINTLNTSNTNVETNNKGRYILVDKKGNILSSMSKETGDGFSKQDLHSELIYLAKRYPTMNDKAMVQSLPITESMKESVMEGMPLFNLQSLPDLQKQRAEAALRKYNAKDYPEMKAAMQDIKRLAEEITAAGETPYTNDDLEKIVSFVTSYNFTIDEAINAIEYSLSPTVAILGSKMRVAVVKKYRSLKLNAKHQELKDAIKDAVDFAKTITDDKTWGEWKLMDEKKRIIIKQVLTQIKNAASKKDINKELDKMFDVLIERQNQVAREVLKKLFDMKISDTSGKGIRVGKNVDDQTRVILSTIKGNMNKSTDNLSEQIADLNDELEQTTDEIKIGELKAKIYGLETSLMYQERVLETQEQIQSIVEEIEKETDKTNKKALNGLLREERSTLQNHLEFFINEIHKIINKGIEERQSFLNNQREHKKEILHDAARDLKNVKIHVNQEVNRSQLRKAALAITNPVRSFSTMLKEIGKYFPEGKGALYDRFVREGILKSVRNEYLGIEAVQNKLKADIKAIFGDKHSLEKLRVFAEKDNGNTIEITRNGVTEPLELKNGQVMYIYMVNKMHDGRMKLDEMGISALDVDKMATSLPDDIIAFCDYVQEDLLPSLRAKYNKTHVKLFGIQMDEIENYFPLKIAKEVVRQNKDVEAPEQSLMPTNATGAIIRRKRNKKTLDIKNSNAIDVLQAHIKEMEYWNAYASMIQDLNTLNASLFFKNKLNALSDGMATRFFELSQIALKKYNSKRSDVDEFSMKASKIIAVSKIALRLNTAIKQILSFVAYFSQADPSFYKYGLKNMINFTESNITWGMENLPLFKERWKSRTGGDDRLSLNKEKLSTMGRFFNKVANIGLVPNAAVDLLACAFGAKTMYDTKYNRYLEMGFDEETAKSKALIDAEIIYNETQQSQEALFLSKVQSDRTFLGAAFSLFNNASFAYGRQLTEGLRGVKAFATNKELMIGNQTKKFIREGLTPENAAKFAKIEVNRSVRGDVLKIGIFGYLVQVVWNFGSDNSVAQSISNIVTMLFGDDDDKEVLIEEKQTELKKALLLGTITPIRGLIGGKELETLVNMTAEGFPSQYVSGAMRSTPLGSDIMGLYEDLMEGYNKSDWKLIANSLLALGTSFTGTNINTIYNSIFSIYDLVSTSDITVHDVAYDLSLLINAPKSDQKELSLIRKEGKNLEEYIQRYVRLKRLHKYGVFSGLQNKEKEAEEISKIINGEKSDMLDKKTIKREAMNVVKVVNVEYQDLKETIKEVKDANKEAKEKGKDKAYKTNTRAYNDAVNVLDKYGDDFKERILTKREISIIKKATDNLRKEIE